MEAVEKILCIGCRVQWPEDETYDGRCPDCAVAEERARTRARARAEHRSVSRAQAKVLLERQLRKRLRERTSWNTIREKRTLDWTGAGDPGAAWIGRREQDLADILALVEALRALQEAAKDAREGLV